MSVFSNRIGDAAKEAGAYTTAILGLLGDRDPMRVLEAMPADVAAAVAGLTDADLDRSEAPGKWSVRRIVRHLADSEIVFAYRLRKIVAEDRPAIQGYDQDLWADHLHYDDEDVAAALEEIRVARGSNLRLIRALDPDQRTRAGVHSERGDESVEHMIRLYAGHDILHLKQIARVRKGLGSLDDFGTRYAQAWCSQDPVKVAAFFSKGGSLTVNDGAPAVGREAIAEVARGFMTAFPDMKVTMDDLEPHSEGTMFRWTLTGTNTGPGGTGQRVRISGYELWRLDADGLVAESKGHFDGAEYERQLEHGLGG